MVVLVIILLYPPLHLMAVDTVGKMVKLVEQVVMVQVVAVVQMVLLVAVELMVIMEGQDSLVVKLVEGVVLQQLERTEQGLLAVLGEKEVMDQRHQLQGQV